MPEKNGKTGLLDGKNKQAVTFSTKLQDLVKRVAGKCMDKRLNQFTSRNVIVNCFGCLL